MKTIRPVLQNLDTGEVTYNCSLAFIARQTGRSKITIQRWAKKFKAGHYTKKLYKNWWIHFDAVEYKQNKVL